MEDQKENKSEQNTSMEQLKMEEDENKEISMEDDILGTQSLLMSESDEDFGDGRTFESKKSPQKNISPKGSKRILDDDGDDVKNKHLLEPLVLNNLDVDVDNKEPKEVVNSNKLSNEIKSDVEDQETEIKKSILNKETNEMRVQNLFLSESDEDLKGDSTFENKSLQKKIIHRRSKRILDSDDDDVENNLLTTQANKEEKLTKKNRISTLIDSDSDIDNKESKDLESEPLNNEIDSDVEVGKIEKEDFKQLNMDLKKSKLKRKTNKNIKNTLHKNESDANSDSQEISKKSKEKNKKSKFQDNADNIKIEFKKTEKNLSLVDSESSDDETEINASDLEASAREANFEINSKEKEKKLKLVRTSAKKAMDEMKAIQSEQQRLHREALISIPYHKPRKHTLDEFLKRRTIIQPQLDSSVVAAIQTKSLKMTSEELEEYAKLMEERAKEATEFFKSESENEEEMVFKDNEGVLDKPAETIEQNCMNISKEPLEITETHNELTENHDDVQLTEEELTELLNVEEQTPQREEEEEQKPTCSKVLITEVIELPKLDMNTVRISPIKTHTPRSSLNIKQLLAEKNLSESPSLSGDPNKLIDLESGDLIDKKPTGMENLMKRLMSTAKSKKSKNSETCNILSVENGKLEMSTVNVSRTETKEVQKEAKPGAAYFELKKSLFNIIKKKRLEELNKKQEDELEYNKCLEDEDDDENDTEKSESDVTYLEEYEPDEKPKNKVVVDEEENALVVAVDNDDNENAVMSSDDEAVKNKEDENDDNVDEDDDDVDEEETYDVKNTDHLDKSQHKSRIIKAFEDTDEEEGQNDDIDFLKTQPPTMHQPLLETQASEKTSPEDEESELMALCSGTFDKSQKTSVNALMSQIPLTQNSVKPGNDEELMKLCSGTFDQTSQNQQGTQFEKSSENKTIYKKILSSDEENDEEQLDNNQNNKKRVKKLTKKLCKRKTKLGFSDDEDADEEESEYEEEEGNFEEDDQHVEELYDNNEMVAEEPETFIDYDSEENEILVQMTKKDKLKQAQNFVEREAELSESEWGSADEDENNLDKYDIELGDEDEFDREKLRTELGKIHARKMLDEDIRAVRKIQEMLFEDEEKDGVGRQRTFKWKNAESGFSLDDGRLLDENGDGQNGDSGDEMNEHQWRKIRYEREQFLKEQGLKLDSQDVSTVLDNTVMQFNSTTRNTTTTKKIQIVAANKKVFSTSDSKTASPFLISTGISTMHKKRVRGSFLARDRETLSKLAGITKGTSSSITVSEMDDTAGTVSIKSIKPKNFVFATLTEEEHENLKRKADDLLNSSNENGIDFMKKPKIEPRRDKCLIDQLL